MSPQLLARLRTLRKELALQYGRAQGIPCNARTRLYMYSQESYGPLPCTYTHARMGLPVADLWPMWFGN